MPKDFSKSKVYKIVCGVTGEVYVGSTTKDYLSQRLTAHRNDFKRWKNGEKRSNVTAYSIFERGNYTIELIESFPCQSWDELRTREGHWIRQISCVNKIIAGRTVQQYREDNREHIKQRSKEYRDAHPEKEKERHKLYRDVHREEMKIKEKIYRDEHQEYIKDYFEKNKDKISEQKKEYNLKNKEYFQERKREYYQKNKEVLKAKQKAREDAKKAQ